MGLWRSNILVVASLGACLAAASCGGETPAAKPVVEEATPTPPPPVETDLGGVLRSSVSNGGTISGEGANFTATLKANSILSVVAEKAPVITGEKITIRAELTAPAGRAVRLYAMRHCGNGQGDEASTADVVGTGAAMPVEVTHTFRADYDCMRLSITAGDKAPIDLTLANVRFVKMPTP